MEKESIEKLSIMIIGDEEVGKTTILERYLKGSFTSERKKTIGVEKYPLSYKDNDTNKSYLINFWDTAGQERFHTITKNYYQRANGMVITMAINKRNSFSNLKMWINSITENNSKKLPIVILCNKFDLESERQISNQEIEQFCNSENKKMYFTSAKTGFNIEPAFNFIINETVKTFEIDSNNKTNIINLEMKNNGINQNKIQSDEKSGCC